MKTKLAENNPITKEMIEDFLRLFKEKGRKESTIGVARRALSRWYESLPADKLLTEDALDQWVEELRKKQMAGTTFSNNMTPVKFFLMYLEDPSLIQELGVYKEKKPASQEHALTQIEYQRLLYTTKALGHKRTYLLIKTICRLGIRSSEVAQLTVGIVRQGELRTTIRGQTRTVKIYEPVRSDLLEYAAERGIDEGPIFIKRDGLPMQHFLIWKEIKKECRRMGLPEDKGTPESLYGTYLETQAMLCAESVEDLDKRYLAFLQKEEMIVGWNQSDAQKKAGKKRKSTALADTMVKQYGNAFDGLSREEEDCVIKKLGESLSDILSRKYGCKITITYNRKEDA